MLVADIDTERLLARFPGVIRSEHVPVLLRLAEEPDRPVTIEHLAADLDAPPNAVAAWCDELSGHLLTHHQWKTTGKRPSTRLTVNQLDLIEEISTRGKDFVTVELTFYRWRTLRSLVATEYLLQRTLYTLEPATLDRLDGLTAP